jgi:hypothetical protein
MTGPDAAKSVFHVRGVDETGKVEVRRILRRRILREAGGLHRRHGGARRSQSPSQYGGKPAACGRSFGMVRRQWGCQETPFPPFCDGLCAPPLTAGRHLLPLGDGDPPRRVP